MESHKQWLPREEFQAEHPDVSRTKKALEGIFPEKQFELFSKEGSSAVIFFDPSEPTVLYKVARDNSDNPYVVREAKTMCILGEQGITSKLYGFIPKRETEEQKKIREILGCREKSTNDHIKFCKLPIIEKDSPLPILIMERIETDKQALANLQEETIFSEANRIGQILKELNFSPGDVEAVWDKNRHCIMMIDMGGMHDKIHAHNGDIFSQVVDMIRFDIRNAKKDLGIM